MATDDEKLVVDVLTFDVDVSTIGSGSTPGPDFVIVDVVDSFDADSSVVEVDFAVAAVMRPFSQSGSGVL